MNRDKLALQAAAITLIEKDAYIAELEAKLAACSRDGLVPVEYLEVDHDDPMHVRHGICWYKDWDSSEWCTLFPDGVLVMSHTSRP